jgi:crossover junction endodeoxyribonuclease RuvC
MKPTAYLGIDPGQSGAIALLSEEQVLVEDWPGDPNAAADAVRKLILGHNFKLAALERVNAMPKQGVSSTFKLGQNVGAWQGILAALGLPYLMPTPREWQKGLVKQSDGPDTKARSLAVARRLFPDAELSRKSDHGRADALLLAWFAKQNG